MAFLHAGVGPVTRCTYGVIVERFNARGANGDFSVQVYSRGGSRGTAKRRDVFLSSLRLYLGSIAFVLLSLVPRALSRFSSSTTTTTTTTYTRYEYLTYARTILLQPYTHVHVLNTQTYSHDTLTQTHEKGMKRDVA